MLSTRQAGTQCPCLLLAASHALRLLRLVLPMSIRRVAAAELPLLAACFCHACARRGTASHPLRLHTPPCGPTLQLATGSYGWRANSLKVVVWFGDAPGKFLCIQHPVLFFVAPFPLPDPSTPHVRATSSTLTRSSTLLSLQATTPSAGATLPTVSS